MFIASMLFYSLLLFFLTFQIHLMALTNFVVHFFLIMFSVLLIFWIILEALSCRAQEKNNSSK